ncbi:MAG: phosphatase PAP2 family protein [Candidatus Krumholzibacteriia bacterium]
MRWQFARRDLGPDRGTAAVRHRSAAAVALAPALTPALTPALAMALAIALAVAGTGCAGPAVGAGAVPGPSEVPAAAAANDTLTPAEPDTLTPAELDTLAPARVDSLAEAVADSLAAEPAVEDPPSSLDIRIFYRIYRSTSVPVSVYLRAADATAYPVFLAAVPAAWLAVALRDDGFARDAARLTAAQIVTGAGIFAIKNTVKRPRPFRALPGVEPRHGLLEPDEIPLDPYSFPSGHTAIAFATLVSWSLSHPRWEVIVPGTVWAVGVGLSRSWLGVHYPSDVLAGALLGSAVAVVVHLVEPERRDDDDAPAAATIPVFSVRFGF